MDTKKNEGMTCVACKESEQVFFFEKAGFDFYRCPLCGMVSVKNIPQNLHAVYGDDYFSGGKQGFGYVDYEEDKKPMRVSFEQYLDYIERFVPQRGRLLDVGSATGFFMGIAKERGWNVSGVEISPYASKIAQEKGYDVKTGMLSDTSFGENLFDVVTMCDVIEHFTDPNIEVSIAHKILRPGGVILVNTTDSGSLYARLLGKYWHLYVPPEHVQCFSAKALRTMLSRYGFEVLVETCPSKKFTLEYVSYMVSHWLKVWPFYGIARFFKNHALGKKMIPINLHDNVLVIARKKS